MGIDSLSQAFSVLAITSPHIYTRRLSCNALTIPSRLLLPHPIADMSTTLFRFGRVKSILAGLCVLSATLNLTGCKVERDQQAAPADEQIKVAFVTNGSASFWTIAEAGCRAAEKDFGVQCTVVTPKDPPDQRRKLEELLITDLDGIAVTPIDPDNQTDILNQVADATNLITHDSDAPNSNRLMYIGMSNYDAGRMAGELVKEALPDGGQVLIFVGRLGQLNADQRRQGLIDELLDRDHDPKRAYDPNNGEIKGDKFTIVSTRTDGFDMGKAKSLAQDALVAYPEVNCMVGLFAYNPPMILDSIKEANKIGEIIVVGFDEDTRTLEAVESGECIGTIVQNPYMYGYKSVEVLAKLAKGDASVIPENKYIEFPARVIKSDNVKEFSTELQSFLDAAATAKPNAEADSDAETDATSEESK
ncbi:D-ribose-binding periplasmic protein precursor [Stieleria bergensis]|uniref:D-ribose-binding periplasmic protein n=2 Tax=Stieleria bergensis TaxID=2528025 RepID=A0A517T074_9BACT|nr:D-ribose-binding periplasmic protein precursor [Planctomycetes bacterium SV_7m_r]